MVLADVCRLAVLTDARSHSGSACTRASASNRTLTVVDHCTTSVAVTTNFWFLQTVPLKWAYWRPSYQPQRTDKHISSPCFFLYFYRPPSHLLFFTSCQNLCVLLSWLLSNIGWYGLDHQLPHRLATVCEAAEQHVGHLRELSCLPSYSHSTLATCRSFRMILPLWAVSAGYRRLSTGVWWTHLWGMVWTESPATSLRLRSWWWNIRSKGPVRTQSASGEQRWTVSSNTNTWASIDNKTGLKTQRLCTKKGQSQLYFLRRLRSFQNHAVDVSSLCGGQHHLLHCSVLGQQGEG